MTSIINGFRFETREENVQTDDFAFESVVTPVVNKTTSKEKKVRHRRRPAATRTSSESQQARWKSSGKSHVSSKRKKDSSKTRRKSKNSKRKNVLPYPYIECPLSVRNTGTASGARKIKALVDNICENELEALKETYKNTPFMLEAVSKVCDGFSDEIERRVAAEMKTPIRQKRNKDGLRINPKNERLRKKKIQLNKLIQQYEREEQEWKAAQDSMITSIASLDINRVEPASLSKNQIDFLSKGTESERQSQILKFAQSLSIQGDCIARAMIATNLFAEKFEHEHQELVKSFKQQTEKTYGDTSNAKNIFGKLMRC